MNIRHKVKKKYCFFNLPVIIVAIGFLKRGVYYSRKSRPDREKVTAFLESAPSNKVKTIKIF